MFVCCYKIEIRNENTGFDLIIEIVSFCVKICYKERFRKRNLRLKSYQSAARFDIIRVGFLFQPPPFRSLILAH